MTEKRLVDANALSESINSGSGTPYQKFFADLCVAAAPTVDAVEVVRCKNCKYSFKNNGHSKKGCPIYDASIWMDDNDFCSHGEREADDWKKID